MPSTYKTPFLGLNTFVGSDKPKMDDFNHDTKMIDEKVQEHFENRDLHWTREEKDKWNNRYIVGTYQGSGDVEREIELGFQPQFGIVFKVDEVPAMFQAGASQMVQYSALFTPQGGTAGCEARPTGFYVININNNAMDGRRLQLNEEGSTYCYLMFR